MSNTKTTVEYNFVSDDDLRLRRDPAFYVADASAHELVATVTSDDRTICVYCDGEMRVHVWNTKKAREANEAPDHIVRYCGDFIDIGIDTDKKLVKNDERMEWGNNAWFDLYAYGEGIDDGWLNCVHHDLMEAVEQAKALINDHDTWKDLK